MAAVYNAAEYYLNASNAERLIRGAEAAARAAEAWSEMPASAEEFSAIMESAAFGGFFGAGIDGGRGDFFSADREVTYKGGSTENFSFDVGGGIAVVRQYYTEIEAVRAAVGALADNTNGAYEITLSFGGVLGGTIAVVLAAVGNSVIWLRELFAETMTELKNSAAATAAYLTQLLDDSITGAAERMPEFGDSSLSFFINTGKRVREMFGGSDDDSGSTGASGFYGDLRGLQVVSPAVGAVNGAALSMQMGAMLGIGGNSFAAGYVPQYRSGASAAGSAEYISYDKAFAAGYMIGDILLRSAGGGYSNTHISKISADVSNIGENTGKAAAASEISGEELKFLRDIAARDVINRFTTAQVSVSMGGVTNNLSGEADLDGIIDYLTSGVKTAMENAAEGVHN